MEVQAQEQGAIAKFDITIAAVQELSAKYMTIKVPTGDKKAYKEARTALTDLVHKRTSIDKRRKELGEDARKWINDVNGVAKELVGIMAPAETHLKSELDAEDFRLAAEKAEKERIEKERVESIRGKIYAMSNLVANLGNLDLPMLEQIKAEVEAVVVTADEYMEMESEANLARMSCLMSLGQAIENRKQIDAEETARKAEAQRLEKQRLDQEAENKRLSEMREKLEREEQERKDKAAKEEADRLARIAAEESERNAKLAAEEAQRRHDADWDAAIVDNKQWELDRERELFEADKKAERDAKEREEIVMRLAAQAKERADREAKEAAERAEADRIAAEIAEALRKAEEERLRPDRDKLINWADDVLQIPMPQCSDDQMRALTAKYYDKIKSVLTQMKEML